MNVLRFSQWMQDEGFHCSLWCVFDSPLHQEAKKTSLALHIIPYHRKYADLPKAWSLARRFAEEEVDFVWIRDTRDMSILGWTKRFCKRPFRLLYQQAMQLGVPKKDPLHTFRFKAIDIWVSPLQFLAKQVRELTHFPHERIKVIPLALDLSQFQETSKKEEARARLDLPEQVFILGTIGRLDPLKGQLFLIEALSLLHKKGFDIHLLLQGDPTKNEGGSYAQLLRDRCHSLGLEDYVHFRPHRSDVAISYAALDLFVMASVGETFGMVTIEAMASGTPVIGTNTSGTPELLGHGERGALYAPDDMEDFLQAVMPLIESEELRRDYASKAQKHVVHHFSRKHVCQQLKAVLLGA